MKNDTAIANCQVLTANSYLQFPVGVETLGEKANYLHECSVNLAKKSTGAAILAGWVLSVARSTCAHGQWLGWLENNVSFGRTTAQNYMSLYEQTLGAARANARRPIALNVEPTEEELEEAAHDIDGKPLSALYKSTGLMATSGNWGGKREDAGRKAKGETVEKLSRQDEAKAIWNGVMQIVSKSSVRDSIPLLGEKETRICLDGVKLIADLLKKHLQEF